MADEISYYSDQDGVRVTVALSSLGRESWTAIINAKVR